MRFSFLKNTAQIITDELLNHPSKLRGFFYIKFIVLQNIIWVARSHKHIMKNDLTLQQKMAFEEIANVLTVRRTTILRHSFH